MLRIKNIKEDLKGFFNLKKDRREAIAKVEPKELPKTYGINELAKVVHPEFIKATISDISKLTSNSSVITLKSDTGKFPYFKAGTFITLSIIIDNSIVTRPYSIYSSPKDALKGIIKVAVQDAGFVSNYLNTKAKVNDKLIVGEPSGDFHYDNLRDSNNIVAIAGGSGITPFVSMAKAIDEGSEDFNLTIIYGIRTLADSMFDFSQIKSNKVKVIYVLSEEEKEGYAHGFITKEILEKYVNDKTNIFMCGPDKMYEFVKSELAKLDFDHSRIRQEHNSIKELKVEKVIKYQLKVHLRDKEYVIDTYNNETLLTSMEKAGLYVPSRCRSGICGFCHSRLVSGKVYSLKEDALRFADKNYNKIHPCMSYPLCDVEIDVPPCDILKEL